MSIPMQDYRTETCRSNEESVINGLGAKGLSS